MKVLEVFYTCLVRQVNEGVREQCLMNSKTEFHQHPVVRIIPVRGLQEEQGEAAGGQAQGGGRGGGGQWRGGRARGRGMVHKGSDSRFVRRIFNF